jgi:hypothetical protein
MPLSPLRSDHAASTLPGLRGGLDPAVTRAEVENVEPPRTFMWLSPVVAASRPPLESPVAPDRPVAGAGGIVSEAIGSDAPVARREVEVPETVALSMLPSPVWTRGRRLGTAGRW